jgi:uncharacterized protein (DUF2267 family)
MDYQILLQKVAALDFVPDEKKADAMIKSVLGHFAGRMIEDHAMKFTADLPEPLDYETLRGHQINVTAISPDQYITDLSKQFDIRNDQAETLTRTIFHTLKKDILKEKSSFWQEYLPEEWAELIKEA